MKRLNPSVYYPVFLNIYQKKCIVVGGGEVALRKVRALLEQGATVQVIAPTLSSELSHLADSNTITVLPRNYEPGDLKNARIIIAATTETETNRRVAMEAKRRGILVNVVDDPEHSDFIVPSCIHRGDLTIAISTAGKSPALARKIRTRLESDFGKEYLSLVKLIGEVRSELKRRRVKVNATIWQDALDLDQLIEMVRAGQIEKAKTTLLNNLEKQVKGK
ncbi:MAG TPA: bifunctional precorrin-2 dehydrogenase/sirohydrochlorin ferrochelatase [Dehalococcoidales bacterium]|nr:bifunctional precorrin-2 dehydrogenase/sirohydrochlorin ferrochelatase [Dehalococcoidales bacterium]